MHRRLIVFTGLAGLAGGLATLALGSSCDAECIRDDRPSVILRVLSVDGSTTVPVSASAVTYEFVGHPREEGSIDGSFTSPPLAADGYCLDSTCSTWALGVDQAGTFDVEVEACGRTYKQRIDAPLDEEACHAETQEVAVMVDCMQPEPVAVGESCDSTKHPSVFIYVAREHEDYLEAVPVEKVWYEYGGRTMDARCAMVDVTGLCSVWVAGWEMAGRFRIFTEWCDVVVQEIASVEMTADGCHVDTEFVVLPVSSRGCMASGVDEPDPDPDPTPREAYG